MAFVTCVCRGAGPHHIRAAEAVGKRPPASKYSPDIEARVPGLHERIKQVQNDYADKL